VRTLKITSAIYLILHLAAPLWPGQMWGVDSLAYQPGLILPFILASGFLFFLVQPCVHRFRRYSAVKCFAVRPLAMGADRVSGFAVRGFFYPDTPARRRQAACS
jgi:hypothetical protein